MVKKITLVFTVIAVNGDFADSAVCLFPNNKWVSGKT